MFHKQTKNWVMITTKGEIIYGKEIADFVHFKEFVFKIEFIDHGVLPSGNTIQILKTYPKEIDTLNKWAQKCEIELKGPFIFKSEWLFSNLDIEKLL
jgi:hypothetical protein